MGAPPCCDLEWGWQTKETDLSLLRPLFVIRNFRTRLAAALLTTLSLACLPALAQTAAPPKPRTPAKPATQEEIFLYTQMGAISTCTLVLDGKIPLDKAIPANVIMIVSVIKGKHGSSIVGAPERLQDEQLTNGTFVQLIGKIKRLCYDKMSASDKSSIDKDISAIEKSIKNAPKQ